MLEIEYKKVQIEKLDMRNKNNKNAEAVSAHKP